MEDFNPSLFFQLYLIYLFPTESFLNIGLNASLWIISSKFFP